MKMKSDVLLIEPYYAGSHKVLMDALYEHLKTLKDVNVMILTMTGKKWHWRARTSALYFAQNIPKTENLKCIFSSCVLPLHELIGLRPDLQCCKKIIYFHENQLVYPVRNSKDRDFQYGYNQIMSCLAADVILFNSKFNQESFLSNIKTFFKLQPDHRPKNLREQIEPKCRVLYFPLQLTGPSNHSLELQVDGNLRLVWPHRWEFDKNPEMFFRVLFELKAQGKSNFRVSILGESFTDNPQIFEEARSNLAEFIDHFGFVSDKEQYYDILKHSDIVISTAHHEFFGVAMLESVHYQCLPLAPNNLVYPEIFPFKQCLYDSEKDLYDRLVTYLSNPESFQQDKCSFFSTFSMEPYCWNKLQHEYMEIVLGDSMNTV